MSSERLDPVFKNVTTADMQTVADAVRADVKLHPHYASCFCPGVEAIAVLFELGYEVKKPQTPGQEVTVSPPSRPSWPGPCTCVCNSGGFCGGCGHAGCAGRKP